MAAQGVICCRELCSEREKKRTKSLFIGIAASSEKCPANAESVSSVIEIDFWSAHVETTSFTSETEESSGISVCIWNACVSSSASRLRARDVVATTSRRRPGGGRALIRTSNVCSTTFENCGPIGTYPRMRSRSSVCVCVFREMKRGEEEEKRRRRREGGECQHTDRNARTYTTSSRKKGIFRRQRES